MKSILVIAPHRNIFNISKKVSLMCDDVNVQLGLLDEAVSIAKHAQKLGVEVIISRGGTIKKIEEAVPAIPVVEIPVSPYDMLQSINLAQKYGSNILVIGFKNIIEGVEKLGPILNINIKTYISENEKDAEKYLNQLINSREKIDVLLGGTVAENLALKYKLPTVLLKTSSSAIELGIREARKLVQVSRKEKEKTEQFKAILQYISEGIIAIDKIGQITMFNSSTKKIADIYDDTVIGQPITKVIPDSKLIEVMDKGKPQLGEIFKLGNTQTLTNRVPIIVKGKTVGAVATFEDITKIQEYEQKIRAEILSKGHIAKYNFKDIVGESDSITNIIHKAKKYSGTDSTVLIVGESGTGKEVFAQSIHSESKRKKGPFVAVNCAAIPHNLVASELFGYSEGAFTGAKKKGKSGLFTQAHGGTIFLDEIAEIPIEVQPMLLRVLEEREVRPVGSNKVIPIDVRVIAATNKNLIQEIDAGNFRSDLYYRLNILSLKVPRLNERIGDIRLLVKHFLKMMCSELKNNITISDEAVDILENYNWKGNIRELKNVIERLVVLNDREILKKDVEESIYEHHNLIQHKGKTLEDIKRNYIFKILDQCNGNQTLAAKILGISRTHLWRMLKEMKQ